MDGSRHLGALVHRMLGRGRALAEAAIQVRRELAGRSLSRVELAEISSRAAQRVTRAHGIRAVVSGALPAGPKVIVANHLGYVDPVVLSALAPCTAIAKRELESWPLVGPALGALGVVFVERGSTPSGARALRKALYALRAGVSVVNFPEGSTSRGQEVLPFARGIFGVAQLSGAVVVPVGISAEHPDVPWVGDSSFLPHYARLVSCSESVLHVRVGEPLRPNAYASAEALRDAARASIQDLLGAGPRAALEPASASDLAAE